MVEHMLDPAHVAFAHHEVQGRREEAGPLSVKVESDITPSGLYGTMIFGFPFSYVAPCTITGSITFPPEITPGMAILGEHAGNPLTQALFLFLTSLKTRFSKEPTPNNVRPVIFCIPVSPDRTRVMWSFPRNFATTPLHMTPKWMLHRTMHKIFDNDALILHEQGKRLQNEGENAYYAPTEADAFVLGFRKWYNDIAGGGPNWGGHIQSNQLPPSPSKRMLLDRHESHVKNCKGCRTALRRFKALEVGLEILALALVGVVTASAAAPLADLRPFSVPMVCGAVLSALLARWLSHFIYNTFYFEDHNHAAAK